MKRNVTLVVLLLLVLVALLLQIFARRATKSERQGTGSLNRVVTEQLSRLAVARPS